MMKTIHDNIYCAYGFTTESKLILCAKQIEQNQLQRNIQYAQHSVLWF